MSGIRSEGTISAGHGNRGARRLLDRQIGRYPNTAARTLYLAITVAATIALYYELYVQGAVATKVIQHYGFTFTEFVLVLIIGNAVGAFASLAAGLADRWGRANLIVGGLLVTALIVEFALPNADSQAWYTFFFALLSIVEGMALVATPALIRDFSPQVGRGVAMGFWTMGPVLGSLVVTEVSSHTLASHPDWQYQFHVCGWVGLAVWFVAFLGLRELSPGLRDQLMVTSRDRALIEARAAGIDPRALLRGQWRQMLRLDVVGPAFAISMFLLLYYAIVAFLVVYFATVFAYSDARANDLGNWYWIANAIALVIAGVLSDVLRVRKPFMIVGAVISLVGLGLFASSATDPHTAFHTFAAYFILMAAGGGIAYVAWMAGFTETVERHNPAATATGLAVWGWILRIVVTVSFAVLTAVVPATTTLVDQGPRVEQIAARYPTAVKVLHTVDPGTLAALQANPADAAAQARAISELSGESVSTIARVSVLSSRYAAQLATAAAIDPATQATLARSPTNAHALATAVVEVARRFGISSTRAMARLVALAGVPRADLVFVEARGPAVQIAAARLRSLATLPPTDAAYLQANGTEVANAQRDVAGQWQGWWWACFGAQILFIPFAFLLAGRWSPRQAREDERTHERWVAEELARLRSARGAAGQAAERAGEADAA